MRLFRSSAPRQQLGRRSEQLALERLQQEGYRILGRNVRFPAGELDIVAQEGNTLCFVEVRSTSSDRWGGALASIGDRKRRRLIRAARWYLARCRGPLPLETRFDVVSVLWEAGSPPAVDVVRGAFTAD